MALQLANYRDTGRFALAYEASMTRLFVNGRTETVRPASSEAFAFVEKIANRGKSVSQPASQCIYRCRSRFRVRANVVNIHGNAMTNVSECRCYNTSKVMLCYAILSYGANTMLHYLLQCMYLC